jgi:DNA-binding transcriptional MerR regulator
VTIVTDSTRYAIGDLADLGGVSRRTVRYYVQEGLLPQPLGLGRGNHYGDEHLAQLLRVKALQEAGRTLDEIRRDLGQRPGRPFDKLRAGPFDKLRTEPPAMTALVAAPDVARPRSLWRRIELAPGVELHVSANNRLPGPAKLEELAQWCRLNCPGGANGEDDAED